MPRQVSAANKLRLSLTLMGLSGTVSRKQLRSAYRQLMLEWHPDLHHDDPEIQRIAHEKAVAINEAFEYLSARLDACDPIVMTYAEPTTRFRSTATDFSRSSQSARSDGFADNSVFEVFVRSSNIRSFGYARTARILYIKFHRGSTYRYFDVPELVFRQFLAAESKGRFANRFIYHSYKYEPC